MYVQAFLAPWHLNILRFPGLSPAIPIRDGGPHVTAAVWPASISSRSPVTVAAWERGEVLQVVELSVGTEGRFRR